MFRQASALKTMKKARGNRSRNWLHSSSNQQPVLEFDIALLTQSATITPILSSIRHFFPGANMSRNLKLALVVVILAVVSVPAFGIFASAHPVAAQTAPSCKDANLLTEIGKDFTDLGP